MSCLQHWASRCFCLALGNFFKRWLEAHPISQHGRQILHDAAHSLLLHQLASTIPPPPLTFLSAAPYWHANVPSLKLLSRKNNEGKVKATITFLDVNSSPSQVA
jgi:hypothetical protein